MIRSCHISFLHARLVWVFFVLITETPADVLAQQSRDALALEVILAQAVPPPLAGSPTPAPAGLRFLAEGAGRSDTNVLLGLTRTDITLTNGNQLLALSFFSDSNHNYVVEFRDDIGPDLCNNWQPLTNAPHNYGIVFTDNNASNRFFRLRRIDIPRSPIFALLANDTGTNSLDGLTSDPTITGLALAFPLGTLLEASLDNSAGPFTTIINLGEPRYFLITRAELADINGAPLADGPHMLYLRAKTLSGLNPNSEFALPFTLDTTAPDTTITNHPPHPSSNTFARFAFTGNDTLTTADQLRFECRLLGTNLSTLNSHLTSWFVCSSPQAFSNLNEGEHTFEVRAIGLVCDVDPTPAAYTWFVDLTPPETYLVVRPPRITNGNSAVIEWTNSEPASAQCRLDGGAWMDCLSPVVLTNLPEGIHNYEIQPIDSSGNPGPITGLSWTNDYTPPPTQYSNACPLDISSHETETFDFYGADNFSLPDKLVFECRHTPPPFSITNSPIPWTPCTSPVTLANLADGRHCFEVRAIDEAGNVDPTPARCCWTVDGIPPDTFLTNTPPTVTSNTSAFFEFTGVDDFTPLSNLLFQCSFDGSVFTNCTSPVTYTNLAEGKHVFAVRAIDLAGNADPTPAIWNWNVNHAPIIVSQPITNFFIPAPAQAPGGGIFLTGHDPDFHAQDVNGPRNINRAAIRFITDPAFNPFAARGITKFLFVESKGSVPGGHRRGVNGLIVSGYQLGTHFDHHDFTTLSNALNQLGVTYCAIVVASDHGGLLRQAELNTLNGRSADIIAFLNAGGGLYAMAESNQGAGLTPQGGHFQFLPFVVSSTPLGQTETGFRVTPFGGSLGLANSDVNGAVSHNVFNSTFGLDVVDFDAQNRIMSLAGRGLVSTGGVSHPYLYQVHAVDADNDSLRYSLVVGPIGLTNDPVTGLLFWDVTTNNIGPHLITVRVTDGQGGVAEQSFILEVFGPGTAVLRGMAFNDINGDGTPDGVPGEPPLTNWTVYLDQNRNGRRDVGERTAATSTNGTYALTGLPGGIFVIGLDLMSGWVQTKPAGRFYEQTLTSGQIIANLDFGAHRPTNSANSNPAFVSTPTTAPLPVSESFVYQALAVDPDGDALNYDLVVHPEGMVVETNTGVVAWRPLLSQRGTHDVILHVQDGRGGFDTQIFVLTVTTNRPPVFTSVPVTQVSVAPELQTQLIDLSRWSLVQFPTTNQSGPAIWTQSASNTAARQSVNAEASALVSDFSSTNAIIEGTFRVDTASDDDYVGFVFYFEDDRNFHLFDWSQGGENNEPRMRLRRVHSRVAVGGSVLNAITDTPDITTLFANNIGWLDQTDYRFTLYQSYNTYSLRILQGTNVVLGVDQFGTNISGRVGFYSYSQEQTVFRSFTRTTLGFNYIYDAVATDPDGDTIGYTLLSAPTNMSIISRTGMVRWTPTPEQVGDHNVTIQASDGQSGALQTFKLSVLSAQIGSPPRGVP